MTSDVLIITPTYKRSIDILDRCIRSVQYQSYNIDNIYHYIGHDGPSDNKDIVHYLADNKWKNIFYYELPAAKNQYGDNVRSFLCNQAQLNHKNFKYIVHLDDDNIIFPNYIIKHIDYLEKNTDKHFSICNIIHLGPLPPHLQPAPNILTGIPPVRKNIDSLQVVCKINTFNSIGGWQHDTKSKGYCSDGYTYELLGSKYAWGHIPDVLAIHL